MKNKNMMEETFWSMLPEGLDVFFEIESYEKTPNKFSLVLKEKNIIPDDLPKRYHGRKITDTTLNNFIADDFPVRGRKGEIILKRRSWKFDGIDEWFKRDITLCAEGTKLEKEFADFLKELNRF